MMTTSTHGTRSDRYDVDEEILTTAEVAPLLRKSPETLKWWRHIGEGPTWFRIGRRQVFYRRADVLAFRDADYGT